MIRRCLSTCLLKVIESGICSTQRNSVAHLLDIAEYGFLLRKNAQERQCKSAAYNQQPSLLSDTNINKPTWRHAKISTLKEDVNSIHTYPTNPRWMHGPHCHDITFLMGKHASIIRSSTLMYSFFFTYLTWSFTQTLRSKYANHSNF